MLLVRAQLGEFFVYIGLCSWIAQKVRVNNVRLHGQAVKTPPFHGGNRGSNPLGVIVRLMVSQGSAVNLIALFKGKSPQVIGLCPMTGFAGNIAWTFSSVGQSNRLITGRSRVQVPEGPLFWPNGSVG